MLILNVFHLAYVIGAKFKRYHSNISPDILDFVIYFWTETICDVINFEQKLSISLEREKIFQKKKQKRYSCSI